MELFLGFVLLLMAGAIVALFAMVGELASRVPDPAATGASSTEVQPLEDARVGHSPVTWPAGLEALGAADTALLLVLSTVCSSCRTLATQLEKERDPFPGRSWGVVVTCGDLANGKQFIKYHGLDRVPHFVDVDADWVLAEFNVQSSPVGVLVAHSTVEAALMFNDVAALNTAIARTLDGHRHEEVAT
jgi:hypothetical protein